MLQRLSRVLHQLSDNRLEKSIVNYRTTEQPLFLAVFLFTRTSILRKIKVQININKHGSLTICFKMNLSKWNTLHW
jgi:hypothetical protein